jgi:hypothetical protein
VSHAGGTRSNLGRGTGHWNMKLRRLLPLVGVVSDNVLRIEVVAWSAQRIPTAVLSAFYAGTYQHTEY